MDSLNNEDIFLNELAYFEYNSYSSSYYSSPDSLSPPLSFDTVPESASTSSTSPPASHKTLLPYQTNSFPPFEPEINHNVITQASIASINLIEDLRALVESDSLTSSAVITSGSSSCSNEKNSMMSNEVEVDESESSTNLIIPVQKVERNFVKDREINLVKEVSREASHGAPRQQVVREGNLYSTEWIRDNNWGREGLCSSNRHPSGLHGSHLSEVHGILPYYRKPYLPPLECRPSDASRPVRFCDGLCYKCGKWIERIKEWHSSPSGLYHDYEADYEKWWLHTEDCHTDPLQMIYDMQANGHNVPTLLSSSHGNPLTNQNSQPGNTNSDAIFYGDRPNARRVAQQDFTYAQHHPNHFYNQLPNRDYESRNDSFIPSVLQTPLPERTIYSTNYFSSGSASSSPENRLDTFSGRQTTKERKERDPRYRRIPKPKSRSKTRERRSISVQSNPYPSLPQEADTTSISLIKPPSTIAPSFNKNNLPPPINIPSNSNKRCFDTNSNSDNRSYDIVVEQPHSSSGNSSIYNADFSSSGESSPNSRSSYQLISIHKHNNYDYENKKRKIETYNFNESVVSRNQCTSEDEFEEENYINRSTRK